MTSLGWRKSWVEQKAGIARRLAHGETGAGYAEAAILLCAALNALSSELWPGRRIDRVRFIELLVRLGPHRETCKTVSVPLLVQSLKSSGRQELGSQLGRALELPESPRILTGPEIDRTETAVLAACPSLSIEEVRRFSYASILYEHVRSSYAHEYRAGEVADEWPMTVKADQHVSYINRLMDIPTMRMERLIHFHAEWLADVIVDVAASVDSEAIVPREVPMRWWIEGA